MSRLRRSVAALAVTAGFGAAAFSGCGDSGGGTSRAPTAPAPNPIAAVVSFGAASAEAYEGDTVSIPIRYEARALSSAWRLRVSPLPGTAESADFSLPNPIVEIPAGSGTSGEVPLDLTALPDDRFEEGTETLSLRLVPDPTVNAQLGGDLPVSLREGGVLVSFGPDPVEVTEGESAVVPVRYEVRNLPSSLRLGLSALAGTAAAADFVLETDSLLVPAGRGVTGTASIPLSATRDGLFSEEDETGSLRLLPPEPRPPGVRLGAATEFVVREGGASPCPGLSIRALPPVVLEPGPGTFDEGLLSTTLTLTQEPSAGDAVLFQRSPYILTEALVERGWPSISVLNFARWRTEAAGSATEHSVDLRWPGEFSLEEPNLEFGFLGNACSGDTLATCSATGCELTTTDPAPPTAALGTPGGLTASATGSDFIEFAWEAVEGATGYEIQMSLTPGDFSTTTTATTAVTRHRFPVAPETTAYARVRALAGNTVSDWSAVVTANNRTTPSLGIPRGLRASATAPDFIEFAWNAVERATSYEIQLSLTPGDFSSVRTAMVTATMHRFDGLAPKTTGYARVRAQEGDRKSEWSDAVSGTSTPAPQPRDATYDLNYQAFISSNAFLQALGAAPYPEGVASADSLVFAEHSRDVVLWEEGGLASPGLEMLAESGNASMLIADATTMGLTVRWQTSDAVLQLIQVTQEITLNYENPCVTYAQGIVPSPDWFVGFTVCAVDGDGIWMEEVPLVAIAWDAGTDDGDDYMAAEAPSSPQQRIRPLDKAPFSPARTPVFVINATLRPVP